MDRKGGRLVKRILNCKLFNNYNGKEYKIKTVHKIFGTISMCAAINGFIDDEQRIGVIVHGKDLYCHKNDNGYNFVENENNVIISDGLMKIFIME